MMMKPCPRHCIAPLSGRQSKTPTRRQVTGVVA